MCIISLRFLHQITRNISEMWSKSMMRLMCRYQRRWVRKRRSSYSTCSAIERCQWISNVYVSLQAPAAPLCAKESLIISFSLPPTVFFPDVDVIFHLAARGESVDKFCRGLLILICSGGRPHPFIPYLSFFLSLPLLSLSLLCLYLFLSHALPWSQNSQLTTAGPRHLLMEFVSRPAWRIPATSRARGHCQRRIKDSSCPGPGRKPTNHISENLSNIPPPPPRLPLSAVLLFFSCYSSHSCFTSSLSTLRWNNSWSPWGLSHTSIW